MDNMATMGTSVLDHTVYEPAQRILTALLPLRMRTSATSLIQGPAKRAGAALGSLLICANLGDSQALVVQGRGSTGLSVAMTPVG